MRVTEISKSIGFNLLGKALVFAYLILLALTLRWSVLEVYVMPFNGMMPSLFAGDHVFVNKMAYGLRAPFFSQYFATWSPPKRGDIIVFRSPFDRKSLSIRRVVGIPGDKIFFEDDHLWLNGQKIPLTLPNDRKKDFSWVRDQDFSDGGLTEDKSHYTHYEEQLADSVYSVLIRKKKAQHLVFGPYLVPPQHYFVLGDNRDRAQDSRTWPKTMPKTRTKRLKQTQDQGAEGGITTEGNPQGEDQNLVFFPDILGRLSYVWFSCEKNLKIIPSLCDFRTIRWNRTLFSVHHRKKL